MTDDTSSLPLDDQFLILLHKKIMNKRGSARRQSKKYYTDQYKKTGVIPKPLILAGKGILEGRKASGRPPALTNEIEKRFTEMVKPRPIRWIIALYLFRKRFDK